MPTSYGANQYVNELYNIRATIDGIEIPFITTLNFNHKVNAARVVTITIDNREALEMMRIGGVLKLNFGLSDAYANKMVAYEEGTLLGLSGSPQPNDFHGIVKIIQPGLARTTVIALDLISELATSKIENIRYQDYGKQDMYMVAKDICDYRNIDTSYLDETMMYDNNVVQGKLNKQFNIYGYQTRKSFLDKLFELMAFNPNDTTLYKSGSTPSTTFMGDPNPFIEFFYAIRQGTRIDFFAPNRFDKRQKPVLKIGPNEANIIGSGTLGQIDAASIVNSVTISSKETPNKSVTLEDGASINKYGIYAKNFEFSGSTNVMNEAAYTILQKFKEPAKVYRMELSNAEWVQLGDLVEVTTPLLGTKELFPVIEKTIIVTNNVVTKLVLGSRSLDAKRLLQLVQR